MRRDITGQLMVTDGETVKHEKAVDYDELLLFTREFH